MVEEGYVKQGYLYDDFRMFHILDHCEREQEFHYHDFYKIVIFISGNVAYNIEGKSYKLAPFDIVLVNKGDIHKPEYVAGEPYERVVFFVSEEYLERHRGEDYGLENCFLQAKAAGSDVLRFPAMVNTGFMEIVRKLERNSTEDRYAKKLYGGALFLELMVLLNRACVEEKDCFSRNVMYNQKMIDIINYINEHLKEELSIDSLSERFYISKYHMMRQFKEETGYTIHNYITEKRVQAASSLIRAGVSATKACYECGFKDYSTFSRAFKKKMDRTPAE
ncbi:MAG: helix-turn-helix domain-containing protein [Lachnospiraceae bacterium]|nr:helix-turn-helix domain-containing protein [Lachnospiraceae bacterium]